MLDKIEAAAIKALTYHCDCGTGACPYCKGTGERRAKKLSELKGEEVKMTCGICKGSGTCVSCDGKVHVKPPRYADCVILAVAINTIQAAARFKSEGRFGEGWDMIDIGFQRVCELGKLQAAANPEAAEEMALAGIQAAKEVMDEDQVPERVRLSSSNALTPAELAELGIEPDE